MRKAKGILSFIVGLALMLQIGTTVAFADDRTVGTVSAAITNATNVHGQLAAQITAAHTLLACVQTLPAVSGGETTRATQNASQMMQSVQGLQTLPSTSTGTQVPLAMLGGIFMSVGVWLLRKPARRNDS